MARIRTIKPQFFRHRRLFLAEQETGLPLRVAFAGLWTCADREGRFKWEPDELKLDCLPYDDVDFSRVMHALFTRGFIVRYASGSREYGVIPSWKDHQVINNREAGSDLPVPPENISELIEEAKEADACGTRGPRDTILHEGKGKEGKGREQEGKGMEIGTRALRVTRPPVPANDEFERFKGAYPKREGAQPWQPARAAFERAVRNGEDPARIIGAARKYADECDRTKITRTEKVAQALTWLNQKRWTDYLDGTEADTRRRAEQDLLMEARGYFWSDDAGKWVQNPPDPPPEPAHVGPIPIPALRRA
jgi:hypothetical protein